MKFLRLLRKKFVKGASDDAAYTALDGRLRPAPAAADRDDRRGQLDARPRGGARARRQQGRGGARGRRLLRLPLRRARGRARAAGDARHSRRGDDAAAADAAGRGDHGAAAAERAPVAIAARAHLDPRFKLFPNLPEDEYESILAVPILAREKLEGALNVRTREPREYSEAEIDLLVAIASQVAQSIEHAKLYADAQRRVHELEALARISEAVSESLYLEESLEAIVKTTMAAVDATGAALVLEDGKIAWPEGRAGAYALRLPLRWKRRADRRARLRPRHAVLGRGSRAARGDRPPRGGRARARPRRHARRARPGDPPPGQEQPADGGLAAAAAGARARASTRARRSTDSVNRILAIAAVHEVLTEHREDDVDLAELIERLRAMLVQGLVAGKDGRGRARAGLARRRPRDGARARLQRAVPERARARRRDGADRARAAAAATSCSRSPTTAPA